MLGPSFSFESFGLFVVFGFSIGPMLFIMVSKKKINIGILKINRLDAVLLTIRFFCNKKPTERLSFSFSIFSF